MMLQSVSDLTVDVTLHLEQEKLSSLGEARGHSSGFFPPLLWNAVSIAVTWSLGFFLQGENLRVSRLNCLECLERSLLEFSLKKKKTTKQQNTKLFSPRYS